MDEHEHDESCAAENEQAADLLLAAGVPHARSRAAIPGIDDIIAASRALREVDMGEIPLSAVFEAGWRR